MLTLLLLLCGKLMKLLGSSLYCKGDFKVIICEAAEDKEYSLSSCSVAIYSRALRWYMWISIYALCVPEYGSPCSLASLIFRVFAALPKAFIFSVFLLSCLRHLPMDSPETVEWLEERRKAPRSVPYMPLLLLIILRKFPFSLLLLPESRWVLLKI